MLLEEKNHYLWRHIILWTESAKCIKHKIILQDKKYTVSREIYGISIPTEPNKISLLVSYLTRIHVVFTLKRNLRQKKVIAASQCSVSLRVLCMSIFSIPYASTSDFGFKVKTIGKVWDLSSINNIFKRGIQRIVVYRYLSYSWVNS